MGIMTSEKIIEIVCNVCGVAPADLQKRSRKEPLPTARALIAHFLYTENNIMPRQISQLVGHDGACRKFGYHYIGRSTWVNERSPYNRKLREMKERIEQIIEQYKSDL